MESAYSSATLWSYGLAAVVYFIAAFHIWYLKQPAGLTRTRIWFLTASTLTSVWATAEFFRWLYPGKFVELVAACLDVLRYGIWQGLLIDLLYRVKKSGPISSRLISIWPALITLLLIFVGVGWQSETILSNEPLGTFSRPAQYASLALVVFGLSLTEQLFRNTPEDARWKIKPIGIGLIALFALELYFLSMTLLFNRVDMDVYTVRGFAAVLIAPLILLTIYRAKAKRIDMALSKSAAFQTTSLVAAGLYLIIASAAGYYVRYLGGSWGGALQLIVIFAAMVILMLLLLSGSVRSRFKVLVGKHFFRYRYDYREEWLKFTKALSTENDPQKVGIRIVNALADMVESPGGALWMRGNERGALSQAARWNFPETEIIEEANSSIMTFLRLSNWVINLEEYRHMPGRYNNLELPLWLADIPNVWLIIPLTTSDGLVGFVVLTTSRTDIDVNWEVIDLLRTAGRQAANYLAGIQATEALLEAQKFDAFNRMSAFVVHDLKNIVTQLSLMVRNAERHADNPEFQRDMLLTVRNSVDRMKQLLLQLREGAAPPEGSAGVALEPLAVRIRNAKTHISPAVEIEIKDKVFVRGDEERIERVLGHLVQNALDATPPQGKVWLRISREQGMALVEVRDTGHGMSAEFLRQHLFKPFHTTKDIGMGIGAYESRQYVRELGGDIRVESTESGGSSFFVKLPLIER